jgi:hypothetical protein
VGDFDLQQDCPSDLSPYGRVPPTRYLLAPGGTIDTGAAFATRLGHGGASPLRGTSFAAAFVSGVSALFLSCERQHSAGLDQNLPTLKEQLASALGRNAYRGWGGFDAGRHGLGSIARS